MGSFRRKAVVGTLVGTYAVLLGVGPRVLGGAAGAVILVASFVVGFAWLLLLVAPWAAQGRPGRPGDARRADARPADARSADSRSRDPRPRGTRERRSGLSAAARRRS